MIIDKKILDELTKKAKASTRLRANLDLRNSPDDLSQRMLNALEPGTVMPIHRHKNTSETCVCIRGHFEEYFYDAGGRLAETVDMRPGGVVLNIEAGQWHSLRCLESGTILLEAKDGAYRPLDEDEIWNKDRGKKSNDNANLIDNGNKSVVAMSSGIVQSHFVFIQKG